MIGWLIIDLDTLASIFSKKNMLNIPYTCTWYQNNHEVILHVFFNIFYFISNMSQNYPKVGRWGEDRRISIPLITSLKLIVQVHVVQTLDIKQTKV